MYNILKKRKNSKTEGRAKNLQYSNKERKHATKGGYEKMSNILIEKKNFIKEGNTQQRVVNIPPERLLFY